MSPILHAKFKDHRTLVEFSFLTIYYRGGHFGYVTWIIYANFGSPFPWRLNINFGVDWPSGVGEDGGRTDDGQTDTGAWVYYKLTLRA